MPGNPFEPAFGVGTSPNVPWPIWMVPTTASIAHPYGQSAPAVAMSHAFIETFTLYFCCAFCCRLAMLTLLVNGLGRIATAVCSEYPGNSVASGKVLNLHCLEGFQKAKGLQRDETLSLTALNDLFPSRDLDRAPRPTWSFSLRERQYRPSSI